MYNFRNKLKIVPHLRTVRLRITLIKAKVYLQMLLPSNYMTPLTCKSTKCLKVPVLQGKLYHEYKTYKSYDRELVKIYVIKNSIYKNSHIGDWVNMFYSKKDIIYFTKYFDDKKVAVKPIYDYRKQMFEFIKLDREEHGEISSNAIYVKSPNGSLYVIYRRAIKMGDKNAVDCIVYNYTKNRIVHRAIGDAHSRIVHTPPIANSFAPIVIVRQEELYIEVVNLVEERVEVIKYSLNDFISRIPSIIQSTIPKSYIKKLIDTPITGYIDQEEYPKYVMTKYKKSVPIYKKVILSIDIAAKEDSFVIPNAILVTVIFENNELVIGLSTGEESYMEIKESKIGKTKIKSGVNLLSKRYKFNNIYDITRSHLYEIDKAGKNFILMNSELYVAQNGNKNDYFVLDYYDGKFSCNDIDLILTYKHILLNMAKVPSKLISDSGLYDFTNWQNKIKYISCDTNRRGGLALLDLKKLYHQARRTLSIEQENYTIIPESDEFVINVDTGKIVKHIICDKDKENYKKVECIYTHYLDNFRGALYIIMIPVYYKDDIYKQSEYAIAIAEIEPRISLKNYKVILSMGPYLYETIEGSNVANLNVMLQLKSNFSNILALYDIISTLSRVTIYLDNVYYSNLNKLGHELLIYNQEITVKINEKYVVVRDIRHNRIASFNHWLQDQFLSFAPIIRRYDNVIMCYWEGSDSSSDEQKLYIVIVISENNMVEHIELRTA
jgi:hypothetical protein